MEFTTQFKIHFDEADPAGIAFSGGLFTKVHRCYEDFVEALGQDASAFFLSPETLYPLLKFQADYHKPLLPLQNYEVKIGVVGLSTSSFTLQYRVTQGDESFATLTSVHVAVNKKTFQKTSIPEDLRVNLQKFELPQ